MCRLRGTHAENELLAWWTAECQRLSNHGRFSLTVYVVTGLCTTLQSSQGSQPNS